MRGPNSHGFMYPFFLLQAQFTRDAVHISNKVHFPTLSTVVFQPALFQLQAVFTPQNGLPSS